MVSSPVEPVRPETNRTESRTGSRQSRGRYCVVRHVADAVRRVYAFTRADRKLNSLDTLLEIVSTRDVEQKGPIPVMAKRAAVERMAGKIPEAMASS